MSVGKKEKKEKEERMPFLTHFAVSAPSKSTDTLTDTVMEVKAFLDEESPVLHNINIFSFCSKANFLLPETQLVFTTKDTEQFGQKLYI